MNESQLFILDREFFGVVSWEDAMATCDGLAECGLYRLPYPTITIRAPSAQFCNWGPGRSVEELMNAKEAAVDMVVELRDYQLGQKNPSMWFVAPSHKHLGPVHEKNISDINQPGSEVDLPRFLANLLITLLATKNIVKETRENKLAKLGIGKKRNRYRYVTTLRLPNPATLETDSEHHTPGHEVCPHLRRGHIRRQRYGPKNQYVRNQWIDPVFVNADREWVKSRVAYNVSMAA